MKKFRGHRAAEWFLLIGGLGLFLFLWTGCTIAPGSSGTALFEPLPPAAKDGGRISVFLNLKEPSAQGIIMQIAEVEILRDEEWIPLAPGPILLDGLKIRDGQVFIGRRSLPAGHYKRLRFKIEKAGIRNSRGKQTFLAITTPIMELAIPAELQLSEGDSESLFLFWDERNSVQNTAMLQPVMHIAPQSSNLVVDLAYVSCPDLDTIYIIRTDKNWVHDSFGISGRPTYLAEDKDPTRQRLYVLASAEAALKVIELQTNQTVDQINIPLTQRPSFLTLSPQGDSAYLLDESTNYVIRLDLESGSIATRARLGQGLGSGTSAGFGYRPQYALFLADQGQLAVSTALSQTVFLLDALSLATMTTLSTGSSPAGLLEHDNLLYIADSGGNSITVFDLSTQQAQKRLNVGLRPRRLLLSDNKIYVSNYGSGTLSVLHPDQLSTAKEIPVGGRPLEMATASSSRWLYVGDEANGGLTVVDLTSGKVATRINLGAPPADIIVVP